MPTLVSPTIDRVKLGKFEMDRKILASFRERQHQTYNRYKDIWVVSSNTNTSGTIILYFCGRKLLHYKATGLLDSDVKKEVVSKLRKIKPSLRSNQPSRTTLRFQISVKKPVELLRTSNLGSEYQYWQVMSESGSLGEFSVTLPRDSDRSPFVSGAQIHKEYRGKGVGKKVYIALVKIYRTLESDKYRTSAQAFRVWRSLNAVRTSHKNEFGSYRYRLTHEQITSRCNRKRN